MFKKISQNFVKSPLKFCLTDFSPQLMACMIRTKLILYGWFAWKLEWMAMVKV